MRMPLAPLRVKKSGLFGLIGLESVEGTRQTKISDFVEGLGHSLLEGNARFRAR